MNLDWSLQPEDPSTDFSDEDLTEDKVRNYYLLIDSLLNCIDSYD